jgi:hypothetical protein
MITHHDGHKKKAHTLQPCFQHVISEDYTILYHHHHRLLYPLHHKLMSNYM